MGLVFSGSWRQRALWLLPFVFLGSYFLGARMLAQDPAPGRFTSVEQTGPRELVDPSNTGRAARAAVSTLTINPTFDDAGMASAGLSPTQILNVHSAFLAAAAQFTSNFNDPINVNIFVTAVPGTGTFASSQPFRVDTNYTEIRNALLGDSKSTDDAIAVGGSGSISVIDPVAGPHRWFILSALAKAIGIIPDDLLGDGTFTFGAGINFSFDPNNVAAGQYDFQGVVLHEISEIMGRYPGLGIVSSGAVSYRPFDLFRFSGPGVRGLTGGPNIQFSLDNGANLLKLFNNAIANAGDAQDWATGTNDAFNAFSSSGVKNGLSAVDLRVMDVIGYDRGTSVQCSYTIGPGSGASVPGSGGSGTINVVTSPGCPWTTSTVVPWLSITSGVTGSGSGSATFLAQANQSATRSGNISIAGQTYLITQAAGSPCVYVLSPGSGASAPAAGGASSITVTTGGGCPWSATSDSNWLIVTGGSSSSGTGSVQYTVLLNSGAQRIGIINVAGQTYTVTQLAAATGPTPANALTLSQFVGGGTEWNTTLLITNLSSTSESFTLNFFDDTGLPKLMPIDTLGMVNTITGTIAPGQLLRYQTGAAATLQVAWALLTPATPSTARLAGFAIFRQTVPSGNSTVSSEGVVDLTGITTSKYVLLYDNLNGPVTVATFANPDPLGSLTILVDIRNETGTVIATDSITLPPLGHTAFVLTDRFPSTAFKRGSIRFNASPKGFTGLGLRFSPFGTFTSFRFLTSADIQ